MSTVRVIYWISYDLDAKSDGLPQLVRAPSVYLHLLICISCSDAAIHRQVEAIANRLSWPSRKRMGRFFGREYDTLTWGSGLISAKINDEEYTIPCTCAHNIWAIDTLNNGSFSLSLQAQ